MSQTIAMNVRTPQPDLAAITRAAQDANLNDYQLRNAPAKSELEALQMQDEMGERTALGSYREATAAGDPQAIDKLAAYPKMQREMYEAFDGMSPKEFMAAKKRAERIANAAKYVGAINPNDLGQNDRWGASAQVLLDEGVIDKRQFNFLIESGPNEFILQQAQTTKQWMDQYGGQKKDDKSPEMKGLEVEKIRAEIDKINRTGADDEASKLKLDLLTAQIDKINAETDAKKNGDNGLNEEAFKSEMAELGEFATRVMKRAYTPEQLAAAEQKIAEKRKAIMDRYGVTNDSAPPPAGPTGAIDPSVPPGSSPSDIQEGATATNPTTGEKIVYEGGQWVPQ